MTCSEQVRGCIFFPSSLRNSVLQDGEDTRRFYWVQNVSVWFSEAPASINWPPSVSRRLQLTGTATPAHCEHHVLCPCALPWLPAAARSWAGTLGYSCLWTLLLQLFFLHTSETLFLLCLTTVPERRGPALIFLSGMCSHATSQKKDPLARGAWAIYWKVKDENSLWWGWWLMFDQNGSFCLKLLIKEAFFHVIEKLPTKSHSQDGIM